MSGGLSVGLTGGLALQPSLGTGFAITFGITVGIAGGFAAGIASGLAGLRYLAFLLCTQRNNPRLPWRLGRFLLWGYSVGLIRIAGIAYQFRHKELQDYLARNPAP
jgi:hypothetical protein